MRGRVSSFILIFGSIFFSAVGAVLALAIFFLVVRLLFGVLSYLPWITYAYALLILLFPAMLFISVYILYFKRTLRYPVKVVKWISISLFMIALLSWVAVLIYDLMLFFKKGSIEIDPYFSYNRVFLTANVTAIFLTGTMQALSLPAEKDWMEKRKESHPEEF